MSSNNNVVSIFQIRKDKNKEQKEYQEELNEHILHKQKMIERVVNRLNTTEIDDKTMLLLSDIYRAFLASWRTGDLKREHTKKREAHNTTNIKTN